jgi:hypothetical protein
MRSLARGTIEQPALVRLTFALNRTAVARRRTVTRAKEAANYFAFGRQPDGKQRGVWHGPGAIPCSHEQVMAWAKTQARQHELTFQAVLSIPEGRLSAEDYCRAMQAGSEVPDWRLLCHDDTAHSHAHVLFFRNERFGKDSFLAWQGRVTEALAAMQPLTVAQDSAAGAWAARSAPEVEL